SICEHDRQRSKCKECGGASICEHDRIRNQCKECGGGSICEHNRIRSYCKECGGSSICEHDRIRNSCRTCSFEQHPERWCNHCTMTFVNPLYKPFCARCFYHLNPDH